MPIVAIRRHQSLNVASRNGMIVREPVFLNNIGANIGFGGAKAVL